MLFSACRCFGNLCMILDFVYDLHVVCSIVDGGFPEARVDVTWWPEGERSQAQRKPTDIDKVSCFWLIFGNVTSTTVWLNPEITGQH